jgi:PhnB protein
LSAGGSDLQAPQQMFWGAYWGTCLDKYGIRWMFNFWMQ